MPNLYWKSGGQTRTLTEKPFQSESELETFIFSNQDILGGDVSVLQRQVRTGAKQGILDMVGVNKDREVCVLELKNPEADDGILLQALGYAVWAEMHPDSIRNVWFQSAVRPEDSEPDWDSLSIRIILIAPSFTAAVRRLASRLAYETDLIQVRRYAFELEEFITVEILPQEGPPGPTVVPVWDWAVYDKLHGPEATAQFRSAVDSVAKLIAKHGWPITYHINKYYTGFYWGNKVVFSVAWGGTRAWNIRLKLSQAPDKAFRGEHWEFQRYDATFHEAIYRPLQPQAPELAEMDALFVSAYEYISGA